MNFKKRQESQGGSDKFLRFKDGEPKTMHLLGEVYEFYAKWVNGKSQLVEANDPEGRSRFRVNAVVVEDGKQTVKVWEFPISVYKQLAAVNEEYPLESIKIKVTRHKSENKTEYNVLPLLREAINPSNMKLDLHVLNPKPLQNKPTPDLYADEPFPSEEDEIPF